jgi:hypothetical protein
MTSTTAARISWLFPAEREVYRVFRTAPTSILEGGDCVRCGSVATDAGRGMRTAVFFAVRDRGTKWQHQDYGVIHRGCVPVPGQELQRIRARSLRATQVRA